MTIFIYKISFPEFTSKVYIGKTNNIKRRWREHGYCINSNENIPLYNAIRKYGLKNTSFVHIATCIKEEYGSEAEINLIKQYNSFHNGYNLTPGGDGFLPGINHPMYGKQQSKEHALKRAKSRMSNPDDPHKFSGDKNCKAKSYKITRKDGMEVYWTSLNDFGLKFGYEKGHLNSLLNGKMNNCKDIVSIVLLNEKIVNDPNLIQVWVASKIEKQWKIYFKNGKEEITNNITEFCKIKNYLPSGISQVISGKRKSHHDIIKIEKL